MSGDANLDPATAKVLAGIADEDLAARYPNRAHFIAADNPHQGEMATRALLDGHPVVIVFPDGHELLVWPDGDSAQSSCHARVEARDSTGDTVPVAGLLDAIPDAWERTQEGLA